MTTQEKKDNIAYWTKEILSLAHQRAAERVERLLNSGAIDVNGWDENDNPMVIPKCIAAALLQDESEAFIISPKIKREVRNLRHFS